MTEERNTITEQVRKHLKQLVKSAGLPPGEESLAKLEEGWLEKMAAFDAQVDQKGMELTDQLSADEEYGALLMTYSGSLLTIGPMGEEGRRVEYQSIGMRNDVPDSAEAESTSLSGDVEIDSIASFSNGPIEKSSPIFKIAVIVEEMEDEEQEELLSEMTRVLTESFVDVNKTIIE